MHELDPFCIRRHSPELCPVDGSSDRLGLRATIALAHEEATGVVKERMDLMDRQKADMKLIGDMAKDLMPFDAANFRAKKQDRQR